MLTRHVVLSARMKPRRVIMQRRVKKRKKKKRKKGRSKTGKKDKNRLQTCLSNLSKKLKLKKSGPYI